MKVILLEDIKNIGKKFEIKDLKEGYVRNYLLPKKLVLIYNAENLKKIENLKKKIEENRKEKLELIEKEKEILKDLVLTFKIKVGEHEEVFGSVNKKEIEKALEEKGIKNFKVNLEKPLKALGIHEVEVNLGENQKVNLKVELKPL